MEILRGFLLVLTFSAVTHACKARSDSAIKVVGGDFAKNGDFMAAVAIPGCSATRVSTDALLTAAHCVTKETRKGPLDPLYKKGGQIKVGLGVSGELPLLLEVTSLWIHSSYLERDKNGDAVNDQPFDLAIIKIKGLPADGGIARIQVKPLTRGDLLHFTGFGCTMLPSYMQPRHHSEAVALDENNPPRDDVEEELFPFQWKAVKFSAYLEQMGYIANINPFGEIIGDKFSGCPGDSGSGVYLGSDRLKIAGVNARINATRTQFSRLDTNGGSDVLQEIGSTTNQGNKK